MVSGTVALHPEGVDRNFPEYDMTAVKKVALYPEGVDRNEMYLAT